MKKIIVGLLTIGSMSAFAIEANDCSVFVKSNTPSIFKKTVQKLKRKGYVVVSDVNQSNHYLNVTLTDMAVLLSPILTLIAWGKMPMEMKNLIILI